MKLISTLLAALFSLSTCALADDTDTTQQNKSYLYEFSMDAEKQTAFTGADLTMSIIEGYRQLDDTIAPGTDSPWINALMVIPRIMVTNYATTFQHEVFGHGARIREAGWRVKSYKFNFDGSGSTSFRYNTKAHPQYMIATSVAGMQATEVLSNKIKSRYVDSGSINPVYGAAYLMSAGDQLTYVYMTNYKENSGHDVQGYITNMNKVYGTNYMSRSKIRSHTAISLLDPFLYFSAYALATGEDFEYPMIPLGDWKYLPAFREIFTPYGLENKFINHFKAPSTPLQLNFIQGSNKRGTSWGAELIVDRIFENGNLDVGFNIATWKQPKLFATNPLTAPKKQGYSGEGNIRLNLNETSAIYTAIGYKTSGFRVGYPMKASALLRAGIAFKF